MIRGTRHCVSRLPSGEQLNMRYVTRQKKRKIWFCTTNEGIKSGEGKEKRREEREGKQLKGPLISAPSSDNKQRKPYSSPILQFQSASDSLEEMRYGGCVQMAFNIDFILYPRTTLNPTRTPWNDLIIFDIQHEQNCRAISLQTDLWCLIRVKLSRAGLIAVLWMVTVLRYIGCRYWRTHLFLEGRAHMYHVCSATTYLWQPSMHFS
jgi:hypothetical protein